jgi:hypothetical protein
MYSNSEYLKQIVSKLERLNLASTGNPNATTHSGFHSGAVKGEPKLEDPLQWMGRAAQQYLSSKHEKS